MLCKMRRWWIDKLLMLVVRKTGSLGISEKKCKHFFLWFEFFMSPSFLCEWSELILLCFSWLLLFLPLSLLFHEQREHLTSLLFLLPLLFVQNVSFVQDHPVQFLQGVSPPCTRILVSSCQTGRENTRLALRYEASRLHLLRRP